MEVQADRHDLPNDPKALQRVTLGQLVERYRDTVSVKKRGHGVERIVLNAFLRHRICGKPLSEIGPGDFASYRDERLKAIKASTLRRELAPLHNMFELARDEWGLPLRENPLHKVRVASGQGRRERRLKNGELDRLVTAARACRNQLILPIILFAIETGMRRSEILSLRWENIGQHQFAVKGERIRWMVDDSFGFGHQLLPGMYKGGRSDHLYQLHAYMSHHARTRLHAASVEGFRSSTDWRECNGNRGFTGFLKSL
ncbi:hypothetical protein [Methyloceanibacter sp.]|uniref:hypothetical protein n=1 Tax=Methyloceanibacter sp. TaxID=1965321 RepID=UPI00351B6915